MANVLDNDIEVSEFELHTHYYIHFWTNTLEKGVNPLIPSYGLNRSPQGVIAKVLDYGLDVSDFEFQSWYYVHFRTNTIGKVLNLTYRPSID